MYGIDIPNGFTIMNKEEPILNVYWEGIDVTSEWLIDGEKKRFETFLPYDMYPDKINVNTLEEWLTTRTVPKTRFDLGLLLKKLYKIPTYSPFEMCRLDHGVQYADFIWIKWKGENITYGDIRIR